MTLATRSHANDATVANDAQTHRNKLELFAVQLGELGKDAVHLRARRTPVSPEIHSNQRAFQRVQIAERRNRNNRSHMPNDFNSWWNDIPVITRFLFGMSIGVTLGESCARRLGCSLTRLTRSRDARFARRSFRANNQRRALASCRA